MSMFFIYFHLLERWSVGKREREGGREREQAERKRQREIIFLCYGSLPNVHHDQDKARLKAGVQNSIWISPVGSRGQHWGHYSLPPEQEAGEIAQWGTQVNTVRWDVDIINHDLTHCTIASTHGLTFCFHFPLNFLKYSFRNFHHKKYLNVIILNEAMLQSTGILWFLQCTLQQT